MGRLGSTSAKHEHIPHRNEANQLFTHRFERVTDVSRCVERTIKFWMHKGQKDAPRYRGAHQRALCGDKHRLKSAMDRSEELIEAAIAADPRLAHKPSWRRSEFGEFAEPSLVACGDDEPCFRRDRQGFSRSPAVGQPIKVVISTDTNEVGSDTPAAFIATARLVMQFRPLEIWWQGAWLKDGPNSWTKYGFVYHVPLIANDTDFSRLEFCIADEQRDSLSYCVGLTMALDNKCLFNGFAGQAERSYLEGSDVFVNHKGIDPDGTSVAYAAAQWLGMDAYYVVQWQESQNANAALQKMPEPTAQPKPQTEEERKRQDDYWKRYNEEADQRKREAEEKRLKAIAA